MTDQDFFSMYGSGNPATMYSANNLAQNTAPIAGAVASPSTNMFGLDDSQMQTLFGGEGQMGALPAATQLGSSLAQSWLGFQQYGLAKDMFSFQKDAFNKNFAMQEDAYNTAKTNQTTTAAAQNA